MGFIKRRLESLIDGVIFAAIIAVGVVVWSLVSKLPAPIIFIAGIAAFAGIVFIWNQIGIWSERTKKKLSQYREKELETVVREWVLIPSLAFNRRAPEETEYFKFVVTDAAGRNVTISRSKNEPSMISILSEITFEDDKRKISKENWEIITDKLSLELARLGIQFMFKDGPNQLKSVRLIEQVLIEDSLTGFRFRQSVVLVIRALVLTRQVSKYTFKELGIGIPVSNEEDR